MLSSGLASPKKIYDDGNLSDYREDGIEVLSPRQASL